MTVADKDAYYALTSDKKKRKMLQEAFKQGDKVYHEKYGAGEFVAFDDEHFYMAHVSFTDGEHVVTALDLEDMKPGQVQPVEEIKPVAEIKPPEVPHNNIVMLPIDQIILTGLNKRGDQAYQDEDFQGLKKSIQEHGFWLHKPLLVRPCVASSTIGVGYPLLAGHRRLRAAQELGLKEVPAVIKVSGDLQAKKMIFLDNFHHKDLEPLEEAEAIQELLADGLTQEELAKDIGMSQSWIANRLRLLKAPDELKEMIISRQITPKHVIVLLPYTEYAIFKEDILPALKEHIENENIPSVNELEELIKNKIEYDWDAEKVLNLDDLPSEIEQCSDYLDLSKCEGCQCIYKLKDNEDDEDSEVQRICLDRRCWSDKVNIAKQKWEKARAEEVAKLAEGSEPKSAVDIDKMEYGTYRVLKYLKFDKSECGNCPKCKKDSDKDLVCIDPACCEKKIKAYSKEEARRTREEAERAFEKLDAYIAEKPTISDAEIRGLIKILMRHLWGDSIKKALKPWTTKGGKWNVDEVDKIPDDDVLKALLRLVFVQDLTAHNYQGINVKAVEKVIAVFEGKPVPKEE